MLVGDDRGCCCVHERPSQVQVVELATSRTTRLPGSYAIDVPRSLGGPTLDVDAMAEGVVPET